MSLFAALRWLIALALSVVTTAALAQETVHFTSLDGTTNLTAYLSRPQSNLQSDTPRPAVRSIWTATIPPESPSAPRLW